MHDQKAAPKSQAESAAQRLRDFFTKLDNPQRRSLPLN